MRQTEKDSTVKIDVTSSVIEKAVETASAFLSDLLSPAMGEVGLLLKDNITSWRFRNQVNILNKSRAYCVKHGISTKAISMKVLVPLLEGAAMEEDEMLQDKWAVLLGNMVDTDQNIENNVFPFILGQISKNEFVVLDQELDRVNREFQKLEDQIAEIENVIQKSPREYHHSPDKRKLKELEDMIIASEYISEENLREFEIANLVRCGLLKEIPLQYGYSRAAEVSPNYSDNMKSNEIQVQIEHLDDAYVFTELGKVFFKVCREKN